MVHVVCELLQETVDVLNAVGGTEGSTKHRHQSQSMQCQRLFHAFLQTMEGGLVRQFQFRFERIQGFLGRVVGRFGVGCFQLAADAGLLTLGQIGLDVLALVILAAPPAGSSQSGRSNRQNGAHRRPIPARVDANEVQCATQEEK
jgi:hypothetical protein